MSDTLILIAGAAAFATLVLGRVAHSNIVRRLAGGLAFLAAAAVAQWVVRSTGVGGKWEEWSAVLVLLALGYLLMRLALLVLFEWLLISRFEIQVPRLARDVIALVLYLLLAAAILRASLGIEVGTLLGRPPSSPSSSVSPFRRRSERSCRGSRSPGSSASRPAAGSRSTASSARSWSWAGVRSCCAPPSASGC